MDLRRTVFLLAASLLFVSMTSAQNVQIDALSEEGVNASFTDSGIHFNTSYLNKTVPYQKALKPDNLSTVDGVNIQTKDKEGALQIQFDYRVASDSQYTELQGAKMGGKIDVKKGEVKSNFINGTVTSDKDEAIEISSRSYYEHLFIDYNITDAGVSQNTSTNQYSGEDPSKLIVEGSVNQLSATKVQQTNTKDNLYEPETTEKFVVALEPDTSISGMDFAGMTHTELQSINYSDDIKPELDANNISTGRIENPENYDFRVWNVTYPADSKKSIEVNFTQPEYNPLTDDPENYEFDYYSYILGSVATFKTETSSEWSNGTFTQTEEVLGNLEIGLDSTTDNTIDAGTDDDQYFSGIKAGVDFEVSENSYVREVDTFDTQDVNELVIRDLTDGTYTSYQGGSPFELSYFLDSSHSYRAIIIGDNRRYTSSYPYPDTSGRLTFQNKAYACNSDGSGCSTADTNIMGLNRISTQKSFSSGSYDSAVYSVSEEKVWDNITVGSLSESSNTDIWVKTSNDGFSTVVESEKVSSSELADGTNTYDLSLSSGASDVKYNISYSGGNPSIGSIELDGKTANTAPDSPTVNNPPDGATGTSDSVSLEVGVSDPDGDSMDVTFYDASDDTQIGTTQTGVVNGSTASVIWSGLNWGASYSWYAVADDGSVTSSSSTWSFTTNNAPDLTSAEFVDDRSSSVTKLLFGVDDYGESDIDTWSGSGNLNSLSNSQLDVDVSLPVSTSYTVSDTLGAVSNTLNVDLSEIDSGIREDDYSHTLDDQRINRTVTISNGDATPINYSLITALPGSNVVQGQSFTGNIPASSSVTHTSVTQDDWISGETEFAYSKYSDSDYNHTVETQRIHNRTELVADNSRDVTFTDVNLSGQCSLTSVADVVSGTSKVTDDCNRDTFTGDWVSVDNSTELSDSSYRHSLTSQRIYVSKNVSEDGGYNWSSVSVPPPQVSGNCVNCELRNIYLGNGETRTEYFNSTSDWITNEQESTTSMGQNFSAESDIDQQVLYNQTQLQVKNTRTFSFSSVDISSKCSVNQSVGVPSGINTVTNSCNNESLTGDWIKNEKNRSPEYVSGTPRFGERLNKKYTVSQGIEVTNVRTDFNLSVNVSSLLSQRDSCNLVNDTVQEIPSDSVQEIEFHKSCKTGNETEWSPVFKTETSDFYKYEAVSTIQVFSNITENRSIEYGIPKTRLDGWGRRDPTETEVSVDGNSNDVSVSEQVFNGQEYVVVVVGDQHGNSSLHEGEHNVSLEYFESKSPGSTSGGATGGGSGSLLPEGSETLLGNVTSDRFNWTVSAITTKNTQQFSIRGYPGDSFENYIVLRNTGNRNVTLDITCTSTGDSCDWVNTSVDRVVLDRNSFTEKTVKISGRVPATFSRKDSPVMFGIKVSDPRFNGSQSSDIGVEYVDFTVTYSPFLGQALDVAYKLFELRELRSPVEWGNDLPYPFVLQPLLVAVVFGGGWRLLSWLNLLRELPNWRYGSSVAVFVLAFILL